MYAIFFDYDNKTYRLPVNPEQIETTTVQANEKYNILKLGQIVVPTNMELTEYTFEVEFPHEALHYVQTENDFKDSDYYFKLFNKWRKDLKPIRFIASNNIGDDINTLALMEDVKVIERAGEEGDKYVTFTLLEYKEFSKKVAIVKTATVIVKKPLATAITNPKSNGFYVVKAGDNLWNIAKKYYGNGALHTKIFNANKDKIKNPSLIYPGQKLVIPA